MFFWRRLKAYFAAADAHHKAQVAAVSDTQEQLAGFDKSLARFAREQAKANMLWEQNQTTQQQLVQNLQATVQENSAAQELLFKMAEERGRTQVSQQLLPDLLRFLDELYQAVLAMEQQASTKEDFSEWAKGLQRLHQRGEEVLSFWDITPLPAIGMPFDPAVHRAVEVVTSITAASPEVVAVMRCGYRQGEELFRLADVVVAKPAASAADSKITD